MMVLTQFPPTINAESANEIKVFSLLLYFTYNLVYLSHAYV